MEYRKLGKTNLNISRLGFGGIPIQRIDREGTKTLVHHMADLGINFIDTARGYTVSEEYLGYALDGIREKFILATKSMARTNADMERDIHISLKNLKSDYIDLYQVHNPSMEQLGQVIEPQGALEALTEAKAQGKIGHIGITAHSPQVFEAALELDWVETIMFPYNIVETQGKELIARCKDKNIGFIAMKPLAGGAIEDATLAIRFMAADPLITVVIPGMADIQEIDENLAAMETPTPLTPEEHEKITNIRESLGTKFCRRCGYCAPCSAGINIPNVFVFEGYLSRYGLESWARDRYSSMTATASDCIECGLCESRCPYELPIQKLLKKAAQRFGS